MKHNALLTTMICALGLAMSTVHAAGTDSDVKSGTKSPNAATPATPFPGEGKAAIPAMPGNPTAQEKVTAYRKKAEAQRAEAAERAAAAREHRDSRPESVSLNRPTKPEIDRPRMHR
jgi:hypothetical protein